MTLFGRDDEIQALAQSTAKVTIVRAVSGVGKSEVLRVGQETDHEALAPAPVRVGNAPGALQQALLEALGAAVAELTRGESAAERIGRLFIDAAQRVAVTRVDELAAAVGRHLLGIVRKRVSDEAADLLDQFAHQLTTTVSEDLASRIADAKDSDVVEVVIGFASEVVAYADGRPLRLALDDCDLLDESDRRRVMDFARRLPDGISLRISFSTWDTDTRDQADTLVMRGAVPIELEGLSEGAIRDWLISEGLDPSWAPDVRAATNGYPIYVLDAIDLLLDADSTAVLADLEPPAVLRMQTEKAWRALDPITKVGAARLAAFTGQLDPHEAAEVLGLSPTEWGALARQLSDSGIFTGVPPWFHQLRRRHLWDHVLTTPEQDEARERAIDYLTPRLALPTVQPAAFVEYARLVPGHSALLSTNPKLEAAASADTDEVAIAGSLIELATPTPTALLAENVLLYAHQVFNAQGDLVAALRRLADRNIVVLASNQIATVVMPTFDSIEVVNLLAGRAASELRRLPLPQVATALFETKLRAQLGDFRSGHYGVGAPRVAELSHQGAQLQRVQADGSIQIGRKGPNLLLRLRYEDLPIYATLAYDDENARDQAAERLDGFSETVWEHPLVVREVIKHPMNPVPSLRFLLAAELLTGKSLTNLIRGATNTPHLEVSISLDEEMTRRAATLNLIRDLCGHTEKLAYSLERQIGYVYSGDESQNEIAHVVGRSGAQRIANVPPLAILGGFQRVEYARLAGLSPGERLGLMTMRSQSHQEEPVLGVLAWLSAQAARFNDQQNRLPIPMRQETLEEALTEALRRTASDAITIATGVAIEGAKSGDDIRSAGRTIYVVLILDRPTPGSFQTAFWTYDVNDTGEFGARVQVVPTDEWNALSASHGGIRPAFVSLFGLDPKEDWNGGTGEARSVLADLLGFRGSELSFRNG